MANFNLGSSRSDSEDAAVIFEEGIDLSTADGKIIRKYVNYKFQIYRENDIQDTTLRDLIKEEFGDFTEDHWKKVDSATLGLVIEYCLTHGFWVNVIDEDGKRFKSFMKGTNKAFVMTKAINKAINEEYNSPGAEWTMKQIEHVEQSFPKISTLTRRTKNQLMGIESRSGTSFSTRYPTIRHSTVTPTPLKYEPPQVTPSKPIATANQEYENMDRRQQSNNLYEDLSRRLFQLDKLYKEENKFSGTGDNFDLKLAIFHNKCRLVGLPPTAYIQGVESMLTGQALARFYAAKYQERDYDDFLKEMRDFYEGPEWQRLNLTKWQTISLSDTISNNPTLSTTECLRKMCTELYKVHQGLNPVYQGSIQLRENIIRACRGHPAVNAGLTNPPDSTPELINSLYTSIINYEAIHNPASSYLLGEKEDESYYIDRQYRKGGPNFRPNGEKYRPLRGREGYQQQRRRKRCFVCDEEGCWSSNHSQKDRDLARKRFERKHPEYRKHSDFDHRMNQYIMHCEGEDPEDNSAQFFEELTLDVSDVVDENHH